MSDHDDATGWRDWAASQLAGLWMADVCRDSNGHARGVAVAQDAGALHMDVLQAQRDGAEWRPLWRGSIDLPELSTYSIASTWLPAGGCLLGLARNGEGAVGMRAAAAGAAGVCDAALATILWDIPEPDIEARIHGWQRPRSLSVKCSNDGEWEPLAELPNRLVTQREFIAAYRRHAVAPSGDAPDFWAWDALRDVWQWDDKLPLVRALVQSANLDEDERLLGGLGAGPLEDMASDWLLDRIGDGIVADRKWLYALSMVWDSEKESRFLTRFDRLLSDADRDWLERAHKR
jgi:hypothetical protein